MPSLVSRFRSGDENPVTPYRPRTQPNQGLVQYHSDPNPQPELSDAPAVPGLARAAEQGMTGTAQGQVRGQLTEDPDEPVLMSGTATADVNDADLNQRFGSALTQAEQGVGNVIGAPIGVAMRAPDWLSSDHGNPLLNIAGDIATVPATVAAGAITGLDIAESIFSRSLSTVIQAGASSNPLYRDGIQLEDFLRMWEMSESMSPGRALTTLGGTIGAQMAGLSSPMGATLGEPGALEQANLLYQFAPGLDPWKNSPYEMDLEEYNRLWDESSIARVASGSADLTWQLVGAKGANAAWKGARYAAGISRNVNYARQLPRLESMFDTYGEAAAAGRVRGVHKWIDELVKADTAVEVNESYMFIKDSPPPIVSKTIANSTDVPFIRDVYLAHKGYLPAVQRLMQSHPDVVWAASNMNGVLRGRLAMEGSAYLNEANIGQRLHRIYDKAIDNEPEYTRLMDAFLTRNKGEAGEVGAPGMWNAVKPGSGKVPMGLGPERILGLPNRIPSLIAEGRQSAHARAIAAKYKGDITDWNVTTLGDSTLGTPITHLVSYTGWANGKKPMGVVDIAGVRGISDMTEEVLATMMSVRAISGIDKPFTVTRRLEDGARKTEAVNSTAFRAGVIDRIITAASDGTNALVRVLEDVNDEILSAILHRYSSDPQVIRDIADQINANRKQSLKDLMEQSGWFTPEGERVIMGPQFVAELANSYVFAPFADIERALAVHYGTRARPGLESVRGLDQVDAQAVLREAAAKPAKAGKAKAKAWHTASEVDRLYNFIQRWWRTEVLVKMPYLIKNSIAEPLVSAFLGHGVMFMDASPVQTTKRFLRNRGRQVQSAYYRSLDATGLSKFSNDARELSRIDAKIRSTQGALDTVLTQAERATVVAELHRSRVYVDDRYNAIWAEMHTSGDLTPPSHTARWRNHLAQMETDLSRLRQSLYTLLDRLDDGWRNDLDGEMPTLAELADEVETLTGEPIPPGQALTDEWVQDMLPPGGAPEIGPPAPGAAPELGPPMGKRIRTPSLIRRTQRAYRAYESSFILPWVDRGKAVAELEAALTELRGEARPLLAAQGPRRAARNTARQREMQGEGTFVTEAGVEAPDIFNPEHYGDAYRQMVSAELSQAQTLDMRYGLEQSNKLRRVAGEGEVLPTDPHYWDDVSWMLNRVRKDPLAALILRGFDTDQIRRWMSTPEGREYQRSMGVYGQVGKREADIELAYPPREVGDSTSPSVAARNTTPVVELSDDAEAMLQRQMDNINNYAPTPAAKEALREGPVTPGQLQTLLGDWHDLKPVNSGGRVYDTVEASNFFYRTTEAIWRNLSAKPEQIIGRYPFATREYRNQLNAMIRDRMEMQGGMMHPSEINAMRHQAVVNTVEEVEKTFYNIRRYRNPVYAARYVMGFPGAYFNSLYRYTRLGYYNPGNAMVLANAWTNLYTALGVDSEGKGTDDWKKVERIVFHLPEAAKNIPGLQDASTDFPIDVKPWNFATQPPSATWTVTFPVNALIRSNPEWNSRLMEAFGYDPNGPEYQGTPYDFLFPFGRPDRPSTLGKKLPGPIGAFADAMTPTWGKGLISLMDPNSDDMKRVASQVFAWNMSKYQASVDAGQTPDLPTFEEAENAARNILLVNALGKGLFPFTTQVTPEGQFYVDQWHQYLDKNKGDREIAEQQYIRDFPELGSADAISWITQSSTRSAFGMPSSVEAYEIITDENAKRMVEKIRSTNPDAPDLISLMFMGADRSFDPAIYDWQRTHNIPGFNETIREQLGPLDLWQRKQTSDDWQTYQREKARRDALLARYGISSPSAAAAKPITDRYNEWLAQFISDPMHSGFRAELEQAGGSGRARQTLSILTQMANDRGWMKAHGGNNAWKTATTYLRERQRAQEAYSQMQTAEGRAGVQDRWDRWVAENLLWKSPDFAYVYDRYLGPIERVDADTGVAVTTPGRDLMGERDEVL